MYCKATLNVIFNKKKQFFNLYHRFYVSNWNLITLHINFLDSRFSSFFSLNCQISGLYRIPGYLTSLCMALECAYHLFF